MKNMEYLRDAGELLAKACTAYHNAVAVKSKCKPDELTSTLNIDDGDYIYKIMITAEPLDED